MNHMNTKQCARLGITTVQEKNLALEEKLVALEKEKERCQMPLGDVAVNLRENSGKLDLWINQSASRDFQTWFFLQDFACVASLSIPYCIVYTYRIFVYILLNLILCCCLIIGMVLHPKHALYIFIRCLGNPLLPIRDSERCASNCGGAWKGRKNPLWSSRTDHPQLLDRSSVMFDVGSSSGYPMARTCAHSWKRN